MTQKQYKNHVRHILKSIKNTFDISASVEEYENLCECIYSSNCKLSYYEFLRIKNQPRKMDFKLFLYCCCELFHQSNLKYEIRLYKLYKCIRISIVPYIPHIKVLNALYYAKVLNSFSSRNPRKIRTKFLQKNKPVNNRFS